MPPQKTIAAVSQPRQRNVAPKPRAPLTQEERRQKTEASAQKQAPSYLAQPEMDFLCRGNPGLRVRPS
jgi:hypothetical protein